MYAIDIGVSFEFGTFSLYPMFSSLLNKPIWLHALDLPKSSNSWTLGTNLSSRIQLKTSALELDLLISLYSLLTTENCLIPLIVVNPCQLISVLILWIVLSSALFSATMGMNMRNSKDDKKAALKITKRVEGQYLSLSLFLSLSSCPFFPSFLSPSLPLPFFLSLKKYCLNKYWVLLALLSTEVD